jgi:hypothetical protein
MVLAVATFASVRSGRRAAGVAERALLAGTQPILAPSRREDPDSKIMFVEGHWVVAPGGGAVAESTPEAIYLAISVRNVGPGLAVLHSWSPGSVNFSPDGARADPATFHRLTRDLYVPSGEIGFWQGALRDPTTTEFTDTAKAIEDKQPFTVDILYGDHEGGQRVISRFILTAHDDHWLAAVGRYWNLDRPEPRSTEPPSAPARRLGTGLSFSRLGIHRKTRLPRRIP